MKRPLGFKTRSIRGSLRASVLFQGLVFLSLLSSLSSCGPPQLNTDLAALDRLLSAVDPVIAIDANLTWSPVTHAFGNQETDTDSSDQTFTLTNSGALDATGCSAPTLSNSTDFTITRDRCTTADVIKDGGTCTVEVRANPTRVGARTTTLSRACTVGGTVTTTTNQITVTGVTPSLLVWSPRTYDFGNQTVGTDSSNQTFTLTNSDRADATDCSAPTLSNSRDFTITRDLCGTADVASRGGTCTVDVKANPSSIGEKTTTLSRDCRTGGTATTTRDLITVTGTNAPPLAFKIQPSNTVSGQNISPTIQVQAETSPGVVDTSYTGTITLALNTTGVSVSGTLSQAAVAGVATFTGISIQKAGNDYSLRASPSISLATSNSFNITAASPTQLVWEKFATLRPINACMGPFNFSSRDAGQNYSAVSSTITSNLSSNGLGVGTFYLTSDCSGGAITSVDILASNYLSQNFYFKNDTAETLTITADPGGGSGLTSVNQSITINARTPDTWIANTSMLAPTARRSHSAVWTGSEMIVWGGYTLISRSNTGERYNPVTDSWGTATQTTGAPLARSSHSAIWTGSEMIIWGGYDGAAYINTGGRYNPATDSWGTATQTTGAPLARSSHSAVWTGSEMIIWGGSTGSATNTGGRYNPATNSWGTATQTTGAPSARTSHSAIWTGSEMIIWGGYDSSLTNTGGRYNPATDSWGAATQTTGAPLARASHSAIWTGSEMIIWGGSTTPIAITNTNTGGRYNPVTDSWGTATQTTGAPIARSSHSAIWTGSEMIVWGGNISGASNTGGRYNPTSDSWGAATRATAGVPSARSLHSAVWTGSEMIVWGGEEEITYVNTGGRYDPVTDSWGTEIQTTGAPSTRFSHSAIWTGSKMIIWGGKHGGPVNTGGIYNPATNSWGAATRTVGAPSARSSHSAIWTGTEMIIWGGDDGSVTNTGGRFDPATNTWGAVTQTTGAPTARSTHSAVWTGTEMIIWGGNTGSVTNTGGRYDPATDSWGTATQTTGAPLARSSHSAVWTGSEMIIWGGNTGSITNTGGRYNPLTDSWGTATKTTGAPSARSSHSAVWTSSEMIIWGGQNGGTALRDGAFYVP